MYMGFNGTVVMFVQFCFIEFYLRARIGILIFLKS